MAAVVSTLAVCLTTTLEGQTVPRDPGRGVGASAVAAGMVRIPAGSYRPLYNLPVSPRRRAAASVSKRTTTRRRVAAFDMDVLPVTNGEYLAFVREHPEWQRSRASKLLVDDAYLRHWAGDLELGDTAPATAPVVSVSWFAARAYLKAQGKQLPTVDQWEYVAAASESERDASRSPALLERLRLWYSRPTPAILPPVTSGLRNVYGVTGLHALIWEWTLDFNSSLVTGESRADASLDRTLYCGAGAVGASDFEDYAAFMRYAFRSSLEARYSVPNLGFRGVRAVRRDRP
jgi:formylglycine-generating enzyme required for sulfatase activity